MVDPGPGEQAAAPKLNVGVVNLEAVRKKPTLTGTRIRLVPLGVEHAEALYESTLDEPQRKLTGTHTRFTPERIREWCAGRADQEDRIDLAIEVVDTGAYVGDLALMELDVPNESMGFRIALVPGRTGGGLGSEAIRLVIAYAFEQIGLHRIQLEVFTFNEPAIRAYEKCGFVHEGVLRDSLTWEGERYDTLVMSVLNTC